MDPRVFFGRPKSWRRFVRRPDESGCGASAPDFELDAPTPSYWTPPSNQGSGVTPCLAKPVGPQRTLTGTICGYPALMTSRTLLCVLAFAACGGGGSERRCSTRPGRQQSDRRPVRHHRDRRRGQPDRERREHEDRTADARHGSRGRHADDGRQRHRDDGAPTASRCSRPSPRAPARSRCRARSRAARSA